MAQLAPHDVDQPTSAEENVNEPLSQQSLTARLEDTAGDDSTPTDGTTEEDFFWMQESLIDEAWFVPYDWDNTAKSADFGRDGYTASLTDWHELLQISAPDASCGLVFVRGSFPNDPSAILARVQQDDHSGGKGTFGIQLLPGSDFDLLTVFTQGLINSRWPYLQYSMETKHRDDEELATESGSYESIAFVKDQTLFQIVRVTAGDVIEDKKHPSVNATDDQQKPDGVQDGAHGDTSRPSTARPSTAQPPTKPKPTRKFIFQVGGKIRFGCSCLPDADGKGQTSTDYWVEADENWATCHSSSYSCILRMRVFVNGLPVHPVERPRGGPSSFSPDTAMSFELLLESSKTQVITVAYTLESDVYEATHPNQTPSPIPTSEELKTYLGLKPESDEATEQAWSRAWQAEGTDESVLTERRAITTCVERILNLSAVPITISDESLQLLTAKGSDMQIPGIPSKNAQFEHANATEDNAAASTAADIAPTDRSPVPGTIKPEVIGEESTSHGGHTLGDHPPHDMAKEISALPSQDFLMSQAGAEPLEKEKAKEREDSDTGNSKLLVDDLEKSNIDDKQISSTNVQNKEKPEGVASDRPVYTRMARKYISIETLNRFGYKYYLDTDSDYVVIERWVPESEQKVIWLHTRDVRARRRLHPSIALTNNYISPRMDLASTFWQVRFLVKAYKFLNAVKIHPGGSEPGDFGDAHSKEDTISQLNIPPSQSHYLTRIQTYLRAIVSWIVHLDIKGKQLISSVSYNRRHEFSSGVPTLQFDAVDACFRVMTVWYVMYYEPGIFDDRTKNFVRLNISKLDMFQEFDGISPKKKSELKISLLRWFRHSCITQLRNWLEVKAVEQYNLQAEAERVVKLSTRRRATDHEIYKPDDEIVDRLSLLAEELFPAESTPLNTTDSKVKLSAQVELCSNLARARLALRSKTSKFHAGIQKSKAGRDRDKERAPSPWELECLNHHGLLMGAINQPEDSEAIKAAKDDCFDFLSSDYSFLTTWDSSRKSMLSEWWSYEVSAVVCSTLLDLKSRAMEQRDQSYSQPLSDVRRNSAVPPATVVDFGQGLAVGGTSQGDRIPISEPSESDKILKLLELQVALAHKQIANQNNIIDMFRKPPPTNSLAVAAQSSEFDWTKLKPVRIEPYHPISWVVSLDDTPQAFLKQQSEKIQLRSEVKKYLRRKNANKDLPPRSWAKVGMSDIVEPKDLAYLSLFDISLGINDMFFISRVCGRAKVAQNIQNMAWEVGTERPDYDRTREIVRLWSQYVNDEIPNTDAVQPSFKTLMETLTEVLNDSLIDQDVSHRILFAERVSRNLVEALIYVWHRDALDTIDSYFIPASRYVNTRLDTWVTTITISHWEIKDSSLDSRYDEERANPLIVPLQQTRSENKFKGVLSKKLSNLSYEETSSSLCITGDKHGRFWTCLVISSQTGGSHMQDSAESVSEKLTFFINQQSSGRCLAFLMLLGSLCVQIAEEYDRIISNLMQMLGLGEKVLMMGFKWEDRDEAVSKLQRMILCLEALRVFGNRLSSSLSSIKDARDGMIRQIDELKQEFGRFHDELEQGYKNIIEEFDKRHGRLDIMHIDIQQKIDQISRLRDGISSVTNVEDSRAAIKQNNNIRVLTYITIAYLPLGYIASLFSIGDSHIVGVQGPGSFAWMTMISAILTFIAAFSIEPIQDRYSEYQQRRAGERLKDAEASAEKKWKLEVSGITDWMGKSNDEKGVKHKDGEEENKKDADKEKIADDTAGHLPRKKTKLRDKLHGLRLRVTNKPDEEAAVEGVNAMLQTENGKPSEMSS